MFESLGLSRDPFSPRFDAYLHVATPDAARRQKKALADLEAGRSLWVKGVAGSGRESFLYSTAEKLAEHNPVIVVEPESVRRPVLARLHGALCKGLLPEDGLAICEEVYARLLEGFWRGAPVIIFASADSLDPADFAELALISELGFMGRKLATFAACGEGEPSPVFDTAVELADPTTEALAGMVRARLGLCGGAGLLEAEVERIAATAGGYSHAMHLASLALGQLRFDRVIPEPETPGATLPPSVFAADALGEVGRLLDEISSFDVE